MKIVVILPTYNERENIVLMIRALQKQFLAVPHDMHILVVDDNSPDGTADLVRSEVSAWPNLHMITGTKQGLGAAYIRGMKYAINELKADAVMEMDSDFSHKPADVPRLLAALDEGADFVIGSRYVPGGKIPDDWSFLTRMNSKWGNVFARYVAGMYKVRDCTAGFRAIRASIINKIDLDELKVQGYAFQISLLHEAIVNHAEGERGPGRVRGPDAGRDEAGAFGHRRVHAERVVDTVRAEQDISEVRRRRRVRRGREPRLVHDVHEHWG